MKKAFGLKPLERGVSALRPSQVVTMERLKNAGELCDDPFWMVRGILNALLWAYIDLKGIMWFTGLRPVPPPGMLGKRVNVSTPKAALGWPPPDTSPPRFCLGLHYHLKEMAQGGVLL